VNIREALRRWVCYANEGMRIEELAEQAYQRWVSQQRIKTLNTLKRH
jgi:hypothetical protein